MCINSAMENKYRKYTGSPSTRETDSSNILKVQCSLALGSFPLVRDGGPSEFILDCFHVSNSSYPIHQQTQLIIFSNAKVKIFTFIP